MEDEDYGDESASGGSRKRLTEAEFATAREIYELGKQGVAEIAADLGVARQTLARRFKAAGAVRGSRAGEVAEAAKVVAERFASRRAELIEETRMAGVNALKQHRIISQKIFVDMARASADPATKDDDFKALGRYGKLMADNIQATLKILDADNYVDEEDLPVLHIEDLTAADILKHHINTGVLPEDATLEDLNTEILDSD